MGAVCGGCKKDKNKENNKAKNKENIRNGNK